MTVALFPPRALRRLAGVLAIAGGVAVVLGVWGPTLWPTLWPTWADARMPLLVGGTGSLVAAVSAYRRSRRATWRSMGLRGFSYCGACNYPFDDALADEAVVTCSECGKRFRAGASREWFRDLAR